MNMLKTPLRQLFEIKEGNILFEGAYTRVYKGGELFNIKT